MINVNIQPFGRSLMAMTLGVMKYNVEQQIKVVKMFQQSAEALNRLDLETKEVESFSIDITASMIDKRFKSSKEFMATGVGSNLQFKKSLTPEERNIQKIAERNALRSRTAYNNALSSHNKRLMDQKTRAAFKSVDVRKFA